MKTRYRAPRALRGAYGTVNYALSHSLGILPFMSKYRIYLRWPPQCVTDSTTTEVTKVAEFAYQHLKSRTDLIGKDVAVAMTLEGQQQRYFDFKTGSERISESADSSPTPPPRTR